MWFFSGIVMMYWGYPEVDAADRLARAPLLDSSRIRVSPGDALARLDAGGAPGQAVVETLAGRPVYRFRFGREPAIVYADTSEPLTLSKSYRKNFCRSTSPRWKYTSPALANWWTA